MEHPHSPGEPFGSPHQILQLSSAIRLANPKDVLYRGYVLSRLMRQNTNEPPVVVINEHGHSLFRLFMDLIDVMGGSEELFNLWLDLHHMPRVKKFVAPHCDPISLCSQLWDMEDVFVNDGFILISVSSPYRGIEIRIDPWKNIVIFTSTPRQLTAFLQFLEGQGLYHISSMMTADNVRHTHHSTTTYLEKIGIFCAHVQAELY